MSETITDHDPGAIANPGDAPGYCLSWLATVDHKRIGILYLLTSLVFFIFGGIEAILIRIQLAVPNNHFLQPDIYNQIFTMHGTTMIFLVAMPALFGIVNYVAAAADRRAGHGLPATERLQLLAGARSAASCCISASSQAARRTWAGLPTRRLSETPLLLAAGSRLLGDLSASSWDWLGGHRDQYHLHGALHARPGHDAAPSAAVHLDQFRQRIHHSRWRSRF